MSCLTAPIMTCFSNQVDGELGDCIQRKTDYSIPVYCATIAFNRYLVYTMGSSYIHIADMHVVETDITTPISADHLSPSGGSSPDLQSNIPSTTATNFHTRQVKMGYFDTTKIAILYSISPEIITCHSAGFLCIWDFFARENSSPLRILKGHSLPINDLAIIHGKLHNVIVSCSDDCSLWVWNDVHSPTDDTSCKISKHSSGLYIYI